MISSILFILLLATGVFLFTKRIRDIRRNILLGKDESRTDRKPERWSTMIRVALGQSKMGKRPVAAFFHLLIYVGFILINIEVIEIIIDGIFQTHRVLSFLGGFYNFMIGTFEVLALLVVLACVVFLIRRNVMRIPRFHMKEMRSWPSLDANIILVTEIVLMFAFLSMNAADHLLQNLGSEHYSQAGSFPVSQWLAPLYAGMSESSLIALERGMWCFHIAGIMAFLVYVPYSKHFHIMLAFPNTWYSRLTPKGSMNNMESVTREVRLMMDPSADPYAAPAEGSESTPSRFGAKDVQDLSWKQLMDAYTCTECGRCSSVCPANLTGKKLSPRKIMMDTRDRLEEVGKLVDASGARVEDGRSLLGDFISEEEVWACTSCNACVEACPVNIDPLGIILDLRRNLIMEESKSPDSITTMFNNIENNGAPWAFPAADRANWRDEIQS